MLTTASQTTDTRHGASTNRLKTPHFAVNSVPDQLYRPPNPTLSVPAPPFWHSPRRQIFFFLYYILFCRRRRRPETKTSNSSVAPQIDPAAGELEWWCVRNGKLARPACVCTSVPTYVYVRGAEVLPIHSLRGCPSTVPKMSVVRPLGFQPSK